jgi:hypothetical protein
MSRLRRLFGLGERAADEANALARAAEPILDDAAQAAKRAADDAAKAEKATRAANITEALTDLSPGRFGRDQLDARLKALGASAKENNLIDATLVRPKGDLNPKLAEEALKRGEPISPSEMASLQKSKQADFDKWETNAAKVRAKNEAVANGKGSSGSGWKAGFAGAALAVSSVVAGITAVSPDGFGFFSKFFGAKTDKILTDTEVGAQQANNLAELQRSGGIQPGNQPAKKVQEAELQSIVKGNIKDYLAFANSKELDPKNVAPDLTPQQSTALMLAFANAQQRAREETNEAKKGLVGKSISLVAGKDGTPVTIDSSNMALFLDNFRKTTEEELNRLNVPEVTKKHLITSIFDPNQQESVASKLALRLDLTR